MKKNQNEENGATTQSTELELHKETSLPLTPVDLNGGNLPDLDAAEEVPLDLMSNYWSPNLPGETKRVFFDCIRIRQIQDNANPEVLIDLPCAFFFEKIKGEVKTISNGSKRLVAAIETNGITRGTPLVITYIGKKRNATNSFSSDDWSIRPLVLNIK